MNIPRTLFESRRNGRGVVRPPGEPAYLVLPDSQKGRDVGDAVVVLKGDVAPVPVRSGHGRLTSSACLSRKRQGGGGWFPCSGCIASERWGSCARFVSAGIDRGPSRCRLMLDCPGTSIPSCKQTAPPGAMESLLRGGRFPYADLLCPARRLPLRMARASGGPAVRFRRHPAAGEEPGRRREGGGQKGYRRGGVIARLR